RTATPRSSRPVFSLFAVWTHCKGPGVIQALQRAVVTCAVLLLAACASPGPAGLDIDRSIQAKGHNSRVKIVVLHYTSLSTKQSLKVLSEQDVSSHYLITDDRRPRVYQLVSENRRAWHVGVSQWYG